MMKALVLTAAMLSLASVASAEPLGPRVDAYLNAYGSAGQFSGVVLIAKGEQAVYSRALGFADLRSHRRMQMDTVFPLASLSKAFTGAAIIDLQRRRRVAFSDPLARTYPDFPNAQRASGNYAVLGSGAAPIAQDEAPMPGASGLQSTANDIYRWMKAIRAGRYGDYAALFYPYGWGRRTYGDQKLIEQSGSVEGFATYMALYENGYYVVALSNVHAGMQVNFGADFAL